MAVIVKDAYTDGRIRVLAKRRGISLTDAIKEAVDETISRDEQNMSKAERLATLRERLQPLFDRLDAMPRTGEPVDKRFYDELWGEEGDE